MPYVVLDGRPDDLTAYLWKQAKAEKGWIVMPAIIWAVRHVLTSEQPHKRRQETLYALLGFAEARGKSYWSRIYSNAIVDLVVDCLMVRHKIRGFLPAGMAMF